MNFDNSLKRASIFVELGRKVVPSKTGKSTTTHPSVRKGS
jgi:hypothetical protein